MTPITAENVPIDRLVPYPGNPRQGDVAAIAESLRVNGQFRPIVAQRSTRYILAGNHTVQAAKTLGWDSISVTWVDCDDLTARRIVLADNRTSDLADYDTGLLHDLLTSLPSLEGTGFTVEDMDRLDGLYADGPMTPTAPLTETEPDTGIHVKAGPIRARLDPDMYQAWHVDLMTNVGGKRSKALAKVRELLQLPTPQKKARANPEASTPTPSNVTMHAVENVPVNTLNPYEGNARQGDVGAIIQSLKAHGQYRPIVVNRQGNQILVGNHTWAAASALGWETIAVAWVDVDDEAARRIVIADNRTSDLATYDTDRLVSLLTSMGMPNITGTGFDLEDVDDLIRGGAPRPTEARPKILVAVNDYRTRLDAHDFSNWVEAFPSTDHVETILTRLGLPTEAVLEASA